MERSVVEEGLQESAAHLRRAREQLADTDLRLSEALALVEDARLRSMASETPLAGWKVDGAEKQLEALVRNRDVIASSVLELRTAQDRLLEQLPKPSNSHVDVQ